MADNVIVLVIKTIPGNCELADFKGKILLTSYSHSASIALGGDVANTERTAGRPNLSEMSFSKPSDVSTTAMYKACTQGTPLGEVVMHVGRVQNGKFMPLIVYKMENSMISRISTSGSSGIPSDSFSLNFTKLQADYTQQASASTSKGSATFNWDLETAKST